MSSCCRCARRLRRRRSSATAIWLAATSRSTSSPTTWHHGRSRLDAFGSLLVGLFGALIAWRTAAGALAVKEVGETSAIIAFPVWIAQALMVPGFLLLAAAGFYLCAHDLLIASRLPRAVQGMSGIEVGLVIFGVMLALMVVRVPIGISMFSSVFAATCTSPAATSTRCSTRSRISPTRGSRTTISS